jgi:hypothetical protein
MQIHAHSLLYFMELLNKAILPFLLMPGKHFSQWLCLALDLFEG